MTASSAGDGRSVVLKGVAPINTDGVGILSFQATTPMDIVGIGVEPNVEIVEVRIGSQIITRSNDGTWEQALAGKAHAAGSGEAPVFVMARVKNTGPAKVLEGFLKVRDVSPVVQAEVVGGPGVPQAPIGSTPVDQNASGRPLVDPGVYVGGAAFGTPGAPRIVSNKPVEGANQPSRGTPSSPRVVGGPVTSASVASRKVGDLPSSTNTTRRVAGPASSAPIASAPIPPIMGSSRVINGPNVGPSYRDMTQDIQMVAARPDERIFGVPKGHAFMLQAMLDGGPPLQPSMRMNLANVVEQAHELGRTIPVSDNELIVAILDDDARSLASHLRTWTPLGTAERERMAKAVRSALFPTPKPQTEAPSSTAPLSDARALPEHKPEPVQTAVHVPPESKPEVETEAPPPPASAGDSASGASPPP